MKPWWKLTHKEKFIRTVWFGPLSLIVFFFVAKDWSKMEEMIGVPLKLLHEAENTVVSLETKQGELFRGYLMEAEVK